MQNGFNINHSIDGLMQLAEKNDSQLAYALYKHTHTLISSPLTSSVHPVFLLGNSMLLCIFEELYVD